MASRTKQPAVDEPAPGANFTPEPVLVINTPEMLKAAGDPLRLKIIEALSNETLTVKQIATRLKEPATKLYYHVAELEEFGFVKLVDTRIKSGIVEKYYHVAAESITVDTRLLNLPGEGEGGMAAMLNATFGATVDDLMHSFKAGLVVIPGAEYDPDANPKSRFIITRCRFHLREDKILEFVGKFASLLKELGEEDQVCEAQIGEAQQGAGDCQSFACTIAFYPQVKDTQEETTQ